MFILTKKLIYMKNKILFSLLIILSLVLILITRCVIGDDFYNITVWGQFIFATPIIYSFSQIFRKQNTKQNRYLIIVIAFIASVISILLATDLANSFYLQKLIMLLIGTVITFLIVKRNDYKNK